MPLESRARLPSLVRSENGSFNDRSPTWISQQNLYSISRFNFQERRTSTLPHCAIHPIQPLSHIVLSGTKYEQLMIAQSETLCEKGLEPIHHHWMPVIWLNIIKSIPYVMLDELYEMQYVQWLEFRWYDSDIPKAMSQNAGNWKRWKSKFVQHWLSAQQSVQWIGCCLIGRLGVWSVSRPANCVRWASYYLLYFVHSCVKVIKIAKLSNIRASSLRVPLTYQYHWAQTTATNGLLIHNKHSQIANGIRVKCLGFVCVKRTAIKLFGQRPNQVDSLEWIHHLKSDCMQMTFIFGVTWHLDIGI